MMALTMLFLMNTGPRHFIYLFFFILFYFFVSVPYSCVPNRFNPFRGGGPRVGEGGARWQRRFRGGEKIDPACAQSP